MPFSSTAIKVAASALLVGACGASQAALSIFTTAASFAAATATPAVDAFTGIPLAFISSPIVRTVGAYGYSASANGGLFGAGTVVNPALSTNLAGDTIVFNGFTGGVQAMGGMFYGSDILGAFLPGQNMTLVARDSFGDIATQTILSATTASFVGFASTGALVSVALEIGNPAAFSVAENVVLAQSALIPEPETYALFLAGLGALAAATRRRKAGRA